MKPFSFNYRLSRAQIVVENAFGHLKVRWRQRNDMITEHIPIVISACCILHNVYEMLLMKDGCKIMP